MRPVRPTHAVVEALAADPLALLTLPEEDLDAALDWLAFRTITVDPPLATTAVGVPDLERCVLALLAEQADARGMVAGSPLSLMAERLGWVTPAPRFTFGPDGELVDACEGGEPPADVVDRESAAEWLGPPLESLIRRGYVRRLRDGVMLVRRVA